jgi:hypothetical protein
MAIVRGLAVIFDGGPERCWAVEIAVEEGGDPLEARAGPCADHAARIQVRRGWWSSN